jgi:predicted porin
MIKKILPTMIGAALIGGMAPAVADVTVFGQIDTSIVNADANVSTTNMVCTTCSLGFKGSEDLGNGLKAIFMLDFQYDTTEANNGKVKTTKGASVTGSTTSLATPVGVTGTAPGALTSASATDSITDRDQWLGLAGNFGQVRFGTISTLYKSHGAMIDPIYRTAAQGRDFGLQSRLHAGAGETGQGRAEDTIRYDSPSWNGLKVGATYTIQTETQADNDSDSPYNVGAEYQNGPFLVFADYITSDAGGDDSAYKVGGKYDLSLSPLMISFLAQYEVDDGLISARGSNQTAGKGDGADTWMLGATAAMGNAMAYFGYGNGEDGGSGSMASSYNVWQLMASYNFSKRTMAYAGFSEIDCDKSDNNVCSAVGSNGGEDDKLSFGMKHKF